jgi:UDP-3-O-acyl-N-acetylglucosamine deacetylase
LGDARTFGFPGDMLAPACAREPGTAALPGREVLRSRNELARHQVLDIIGDLSLIGMPVIGHVIAHQSSHSLNARMVARLLHNSRHWVLAGDQEADVPQREAVVYPEMVVI